MDDKRWLSVSKIVVGFSLTICGIGVILSILIHVVLFFWTDFANIVSLLVYGIFAIVAPSLFLIEFVTKKYVKDWKIRKGYSIALHLSIILLIIYAAIIGIALLGGGRSIIRMHNYRGDENGIGIFYYRKLIIMSSICIIFYLYPIAYFCKRMVKPEY